MATSEDEAGSATSNFASVIFDIVVTVDAFVVVINLNLSASASQNNSPWFSEPLLKNIPESSVSAVELFLLTIKNWSSIVNVVDFIYFLVPSRTKSRWIVVVFVSKNTEFDPLAPVPVLIV